jgi:hypothetical protein
MTRIKHAPRMFALAFALLLSSVASAQTPAAAGNAADTPAGVVRAFYKALNERRFREAFALSVYRAGVEGLSAEEFEDLRPDFERNAAYVPPTIEVTGEVVNGDAASVFIKPIDRGEEARSEEVKLIREGGRWIVGERPALEAVAREGKNFFFRARIEAHQEEVERMLGRIAAAQLVHGAQNGGQFGDLATLVRTGLVPADLLGTESTGYRFTVMLGKGGRSWAARAEPERYNRTGQLSFYSDASGIQKKDNGGKPIKTSAPK